MTHNSLPDTFEYNSQSQVEIETFGGQSKPTLGYRINPSIVKTEATVDEETVTKACNEIELEPGMVIAAHTILTGLNTWYPYTVVDSYTPSPFTTKYRLKPFSESLQSMDLTIPENESYIISGGSEKEFIKIEQNGLHYIPDSVVADLCDIKDHYTLHNI